MGIPGIVLWLFVFSAVAAAVSEKSLRHVEINKKVSKSVELLSRAQGPDPNQVAIHRGSGNFKTQCATLDLATYNGLAVNQNNGVVVVSNSVGTYRQYYNADCWEQISTLELKKLATTYDDSSNLLVFGIGVSDGKVYRGVYFSNVSSYSFSVLLGDATYSDLLLLPQSHFGPSEYTLAAVTSTSIALNQYNADASNSIAATKTVTRASVNDKPFFLSTSYLCQSIASSGAITCSTIGSSTDSDNSVATALEAITVTNVNNVCGSMDGVLFVTDSFSKLQAYYYDNSGAFELREDEALGTNTWVVASCDHYNSFQLTLVVSSTPSIVKTYTTSGGYLTATADLESQEIDVTSSSLITNYQGDTYFVLVPTYNLIQAFGGIYTNNYYYGGDGLRFQEDFGIIYGFYLLYFFGLILIALVLDITKFFDIFVIPLARRSYINMEDRLLKQLFQTTYLKAHPEMKDVKSESADDEKFLDWEDADMVAEYTDFISHRKLVAAAAEDGDLGAESRTHEQTEPTPGGCFSRIVSCFNFFAEWLRSYYNLCIHPKASKQVQIPAWYFNATRDMLYLNTTPYNPDDRRRYLDLIFFKFPYAKGYWVSSLK